MKNLLIKGLIGATTLTLGITALTWNGGATLENAKEKISGLTSIVEVFKSNESQLKEKVVTLNKEVKEKAELISSLETRIQELENSLLNSGNDNQELIKQIETLKSEKAELENERAELISALENAQNEVARLEGELNKANGEISRANEQAQLLQQELDKINMENYSPLSQEELNKILNGEEITTPGNGEEETPGNGEEETQTKVINWNITNNSTLTTDKFQLTYIDNREYGYVEEVSVLSTTQETKDQPLIIKFNGGTSNEIFYRQNYTFGKEDINGSKIEVFDKQGNLLEVINIVR